ncbi:MAG TPA: cytochrome c [Polyangiales bacterium]|nr:cytochrome c [Polyangiales bacterium]
MLKKLFIGLGIVVVLVALGGGAFALVQASAFDASLNKVYDIAPLQLQAVNDPAVIERGKHLVESIGGCGECHGKDLGGKEGEEMGPIGKVDAPNLTSGKGGVSSQYSDGQFARVIRHGIKASGKSLRFMPAQDIAWWPDDDLVALVSYLRSLPPVYRTLGESHIGLLGKVLDRLGVLPLDIARRIDHGEARPKTLPAEVTAEYGAKLARGCTGCHGDHFGGGPIPGAPSDLPVPANITPHETGLARMTEAEWNRLLDQGIKRDGKPLNAFMPIQMLRAMNPTERAALWTFLRSLPPRPFGER